MEMNGFTLIKLGFNITCLGKDLHDNRLYYYMDGLVFEFIDNNTDLELEQKECEEYLFNNKPTAGDEEDMNDGITIVRQVLEEIKIYKKHVLRQ